MPFSAPQPARRWSVSAFRLAAAAAAVCAAVQLVGLLLPQQQNHPRPGVPPVAAGAGTAGAASGPPYSSPAEPTPPLGQAARGSAADCEAVMRDTGGVLGLPPELFYSQIQRRMTVGEPRRSGPCNWTLDLRHILMPGIEVTSTNLSTHVPAGTVGTVQTVGVWTDLIPEDNVPVRWQGRYGMRGVPARALRPMMRSLDLVFGADQCPVVLQRALGGAGSAFDLAPRTAARLAALGPAAAALHPLGWNTATVRWCAHPGFFADFCRACGYSCNLFSTWSPERVHYSHFAYPLGIPTGDHAGPTPPCQVFVEKSLVFPKRDSRKVLPMVRVQHRLRLYGATAAQYETAVRMGWDVRERSEGTLAEQPCVGKPADALTFFFGITKLRKVLYINVGHWFHDVFFPLFQTISIYVNLTAERVPEYYVQMLPGQWEWSWMPMPELAGMAHLLTSLAPVRPPLRQGQCYSRAVFDCPLANTMGPMRPMQNWLERKHGFSFAPLPWPAAGSGRRPLLLMLLRRWGGDRFLANWEQLAAAARREGYDVQHPLSTEGSGPENRAAKLLRLAADMQRAHVLVGCHGAEIAGMPFMPRGSVVVEILPTAMRYLDMWYVRQAEAAELSLVRWVLHHRHVFWAAPAPREQLHSGSENCSRGVVTNLGQGSARKEMAKNMCWQLPADPSTVFNQTLIPRHCEKNPVCLRTTSSDLRPPAPEWARLLGLVTALLQRPPQGDPVSARGTGRGPGVEASRSVSFNPQRWLRKTKKLYTGAGFI
eukprot:TRINITY_DN5802_c1_g2_i1.p1 TRINITY_DN5802_c1_g2~~TRINITY_DN5802_c1_g2_i1.p1  ORF type:complete len:766 (+),score=201.44 TRINITY_DN5802_c1_g2_i1:79-2376(+)